MQSLKEGIEGVLQEIEKRNREKENSREAKGQRLDQ